MSEYTEAVERGMKDMEGVSTGKCPGCEECMQLDECDCSNVDEHRRRWQAGELNDEPSFSHCACGICGTTLGGDRHIWHWINKSPGLATGIYHEDDACTDCVMYLAYGTEPEGWRAR